MAIKQKLPFLPNKEAPCFLIGNKQNETLDSIFKNYFIKEAVTEIDKNAQSENSVVLQD
jgi:hypothetical protein